VNQVIDFSLPVFWSVNLASEKAWFDKSNQDGAEWFNLQSAVESGVEDITSMSLWVQKRVPQHHITSIKVGEDKQGYFFAKKSTITFGDNTSNELYGAGYLDGDTVKITWYNNQLEAIMFEERPAEEAGFSLIRCKNKNTTAISSQDSQ
jgi:hypothetical protein